MEAIVLFGCPQVVWKHTKLFGIIIMLIGYKDIKCMYLFDNQYALFKQKPKFIILDGIATNIEV